MYFKNLLATGIILSIACTGFSQQAIVVQVIDKTNSKPLPDAELLIEGITVSMSDSLGILWVDTGVYKQNAVFYKQGYKPKEITITRIPPKIYMEALQNELSEVVVRDKHSELLLKSGNENVIDYVFVEDSFLVASYNINGKRTDKLSLLDNNGHKLMQSTIPINTEKIFRSCVGRYYIVSTNAIYPVSINREANSIALGKPMSLNDYALLQQCVLFRDDVYYYKFLNPASFNVAFYMAGKYDTDMKAFCKLSQPKTLDASIDNLGQIYEALAAGDTKRAAQLTFMRKMLDRLSFRNINADLFEIEDTLVVFDFEAKSIRFFKHDGTSLKQIPMLFFQKSIQKVQVVQDCATQRFYLLNTYSSNNKLTPVDIVTGDITGKPIILENPFIENVKLKDGRVYYTWKKEALMPMQLFIDKYAIKE